MKSKNMTSMLYWFLSAALLDNASSVVIQALIDIDDNSEHLIGSLIRKMDHIVDPGNDDLANISLSLAHALLTLAPKLSITGNISDGNESKTLSFSISASALDFSKDSENDKASENEYFYMWNKKKGGVLEPILEVIEPWILFILEVTAHSILSVIVTQLLQATALLENVPFT